MVYDNSNIFAKIISGAMPADKIYEDEKLLAFKDITPAAPIHILVIPKGEYVSFDDFAINAGEEAIADFFAKVRQIANEQNLQESGYRLITNHGVDASQSVPHFHVHILGGKQLGGLVPGDESQR